MSSIIVEPAGVKPLANVIFLHGLGANGHDFEPIAEQLQPILPLRWILPTAHSIPVTINGDIPMPAWFDMTDLTRADGVDWNSVAYTKQYIHNLLRIEYANTPDIPLIIGGFSQGGAISLSCGFDSPVPLKGILALSSYIIAHEGETGLPANLDAKSAPLVFMGHGEWDEVLPLELAETSHAAMQSAGINVEWHKYPIPHSVSQEELQDMVFWLMRLLGIKPESIKPE